MDNDHDPAGSFGNPVRSRMRTRVSDRPAQGSYPPQAYLADPPLIEQDIEHDFDSSGVSVARLRMEQEHARYNELYLLAPVGYFLVGFDSTILQVNLVGAELLGVARATPGLHRLRDLVAPAFHADFDAVFSRALNSSIAQTCRLQMLRARSSRPLQVTMRASADGSGQACRIVLERAEGKLAALERSEERLRRIVHNVHEGIWEIDAYGRTTFVNPTMARMLGYGIEDMLDRPLVAFMDEEGKAVMEANIARRQRGGSERQQFKFIAKEGRAVWTTLSTNPIFDGQGMYIGALALVNDISARKDANELVWRQANYDSLTGLPNRHMFMDRLAQETRKAERNGTFLALMFIDLDHFKDINDTRGHAAGDHVLAEASRRLASCVRSTDTLARLGGDEFTVILAGLDHVGSVERIAQTMRSVLALPIDLDGQRAVVSASIGVALYPPDARDLNGLVECADQAMYASKNAGGDRFSYFTPDLQEAAQARQNIVSDLRAALAAGQFEILYQPIVSLQNGAVHKAEALLRWRHPTRGLLAPAEFIPFAESNGLIAEIGDWVFREAAKQVQHWQHSIHPHFQVSVNKSPLQFRRDAAQYENWIAYLDELGLPANSIVIEITENVLMEGVEQVIERLRQFRAMGLQVSLDDFGTGFSSLSHLKRFDIDFVKIDQSFVGSLEDDTGDLALCEAIIVMAHKLGLKVIAEGVETKVQRALLVDAGCDYAQGYVFAHPMPAADFEAMAKAAVPRLPH